MSYGSGSMRAAWGCFFAALLVTACAEAPMSMRGPAQTPTIEQFSASDISFSVRGTQDTVLRDIVDFLSDKAMFHRVEMRSPQVFVVTAFFDEPAPPGARRLRKTAYRFLVGTPQLGLECAPLAITWLTQSRGLREEVWSIQPGDANLEPSAWPQIRAMLEQRRCAK